MSRVLITGGAGFIGANLARRYLSAGNQVTLFDNFSRKGSESNLEWLKKDFPDVSVVKDDIRNAEALKAAIGDDTDHVFHLAGQVAVTTSVQNPQEDFAINGQGTLNVLEAIRTAKKQPTVIYSSTNKVYGGMEHLKINEGDDAYSYADYPNGIPEDFGLDFHSPYGCSKGTADQYIRDYARIYGLKTVVFRQSCIYGYRQFGIEDQGWLAWFILRAVFDKQLNIYGTGKQVRDVLFVEDLLDAFQMATENVSSTAGQIYNIGGGPNKILSLNQAIELIESVLGKKMNIIKADARPGDQKVYISDISKAEKDFGWSPKVAPADGIKKLADWIVSNKELFSI